MSELSEWTEQLVPLLATGKHVAASGVTLMFLIRLYRMEAVQKRISQRARWDSLPPLAKVLLPFLLSLAGGVLVSFQSGASALSALLLSLPAALAAVSLHHGTKAVGQMATNAELKAEGLPYEPGDLRVALSLVIPIGKVPSIEDWENRLD